MGIDKILKGYCLFMEVEWEFVVKMNCWVLLIIFVWGN